MQIPTDYPKTLYLLQATDTSMYVVAAVVIYYYGGRDGQSCPNPQHERQASC